MSKRYDSKICKIFFVIANSSLRIGAKGIFMYNFAIGFTHIKFS